MNQTFDVAVIGAGVFGTWTAYELNRAGLRLRKKQQCPWVFIEGSWNGSDFFSADNGEVFCT